MSPSLNIIPPAHSTLHALATWDMDEPNSITHTSSNCWTARWLVIELIFFFIHANVYFSVLFAMQLRTTSPSTEVQFQLRFNNFTWKYKITIHGTCYLQCLVQRSQGIMQIQIISLSALIRSIYNTNNCYI